MSVCARVAMVVPTLTYSSWWRQRVTLGFTRTKTMVWWALQRRWEAFCCGTLKRALLRCSFEHGLISPRRCLLIDYTALLASGVLCGRFFFILRFLSKLCEERGNRAFNEMINGTGLCNIKLRIDMTGSVAALDFYDGISCWIMSFSVPFLTG